jgi:hypothetical protein
MGVGPENCTTHGCQELRVQHSVKCVRHHFEMVRRRPFPEKVKAG